MVNKLSGVVEAEEFDILPADFVKKAADAEDRIPQKSRAAIYSGKVHVSSLANNFCARNYAITIHEKLQQFETVSGGHKVTWALGRAAEKHLREAFFNQHGLHNIYAKWSCECGKSYYEGLYNKNMRCPCGKSVDVFNEPDIEDAENCVKGHPDLVFKYKSTYFVGEIKSMKKDQWDELTEPLESHIRQAGMYPSLLSNKLGRVSPIVTFIYVTKDFKFGSPYKEFHVNVDEERYKKEREELLAEAKQVRQFVEEGITPPRICQSIGSNLAKKCPNSARCFFTYQDEIK